VSVDCAPFHYVEPSSDWNTAEELTVTSDSGPAAAQQTDFTATGRRGGGSRVENELPPEAQGQSQRRVQGGTGSRKHGEPSVAKKDDTGDMLYCETLNVHVPCISRFPRG